MIAHLCHAIGCRVHVPPEMLCCGRHWAMVPVHLKHRVWRNYRKGQCDDKRPSLAWCYAADDVIRHIALREGQPWTYRWTFRAAFFPHAPPPHSRRG